MRETLCVCCRRETPNQPLVTTATTSIAQECIMVFGRKKTFMKKDKKIKRSTDKSLLQLFKLDWWDKDETFTILDPKHTSWCVKHERFDVMNLHGFSWEAYSSWLMMSYMRTTEKSSRPSTETFSVSTKNTQTTKEFIRGRKWFQLCRRCILPTTWKNLLDKQHRNEAFRKPWKKYH